MEFVFRNATIVDGADHPAFRGDVAVSDGRISYVGRHDRGDTAPPSGAVEIDSTGLYLAPGFIDIHNHSDLSLFREPRAPNYVYQGVTTLVVGNCGWSGAPVDVSRPDIASLVGDDRLLALVTWASFPDYLEALERLPKAVNVATLVGHGNVRAAVIGSGDAQPGPAELDRMKRLVGEAVAAGAFGLSTGLIYVPGMFAGTEEIVELARVAAQLGGLYATHLRSESDLLVDALVEAIRIGREAGARVQISHHKASGRRNWGLVRTTLELMEYYRRFGLEISCDVYPCTAGATGLQALLPAWCQRNGKAGFLAIARDPAAREKAKADLRRPQTTWSNLYLDAGPSGVRVAESLVFPEYLGLSLADIAAGGGPSRAPGADPLDVMLDLLERDYDLGITVAGMSEDDMRYVLLHRLGLVGSDAGVVVPGEGLPHPRSYRAFTRVLATYSRDLGLVPLERAIAKMTGLPAWKLGLRDRGLIVPGAAADLCAFDLWGLGSEADYGDPHHYSSGMVHVLVNGEFVLRNGAPTGALPGTLLRRS